MSIVAATARLSIRTASRRPVPGRFATTTGKRCSSALARKDTQSLPYQLITNVTTPSFDFDEKPPFPPRLQSRFLEQIPVDLPFAIPSTSVLANVGNTPVHEVEPGVIAKLEGFNMSGSIKDRAVLCMVLGMFERGELKDGSTLMLVTSGSAGLALSLIQRALAIDCGVNLRTVIVMPKPYEAKAVPQRMIANGTPVSYDTPDPDAMCQLLFLDGPFVDTMKAGNAMAEQSGWSVLNQHYDMNSMLAHKSTAMELIEQVPDVTDVVCATGTGATAAGLRTFLPDHVSVHSRPSESGAIDGLSDVARYDNFCDPKSLEGYGNGLFGADCAKFHQEELKSVHGLASGQSSGATFWLAREVKRAKPDAKVVFISACGKPCEE
jgi:cysteine synthase A